MLTFFHRLYSKGLNGAMRNGEVSRPHSAGHPPMLKRFFSKSDIPFFAR